MPRTLIASQAPAGIYSPASVAALTFVSADASNGNFMRMNGGEFLVLKGSGAFTIASVPDDLGRTRDLTGTVGAGETILIGPWAVSGYGQANGSLYLDAAAGVSIAWVSPLR